MNCYFLGSIPHCFTQGAALLPLNTVRCISCCCCEHSNLNGPPGCCTTYFTERWVPSYCSMYFTGSCVPCYCSMQFTESWFGWFFRHWAMRFTRTYILCLSGPGEYCNGMSRCECVKRSSGECITLTPCETSNNCKTLDAKAECDTESAVCVCPSKLRLSIRGCVADLKGLFPMYMSMSMCMSMSVLLICLFILTEKGTLAKTSNKNRLVSPILVILRPAISQPHKSCLLTEQEPIMGAGWTPFCVSNLSSHATLIE